MTTVEDQKKTPDQSTTEPEGKDEKTSYTKDEVEAMKKEMESNFEKGFQKKLSKVKEEFSQESDKLVSAIGEVAKDPSNLLQVNETDPKTAKLILDKYYDGMSVESYQIKILGIDPDEIKTVKPIDKKQLEEQIRKEIEQEKVQEQIESSYNHFIAENNLTGDDLKNFQEEYNDLTEGKTLTAEKQAKYLKTALLSSGYTPPKKDNTKAVANIMATAKSSTGGNGKGKSVSNRVESAREFLQQYK